MKWLRYLALYGALATVSPGALAADAPPAAPPQMPPATDATASPAAPSPAPGDEEAISAEVRQSAAADAVDLDVGGKKVLALFRPDSSGHPQGAVVLLHDLDAHADWPATIAPLRRQLPAFGWATLSVELPAPTADTTPGDLGPLIDNAQKRIQAALLNLKGRNIRNIVLLGHGLGALDGLRFAAENPDPALTGLVMVALDGGRDPQWPKTAEGWLERINMPVYDLYGTDDRLAVTAAAAAREALARRLNDSHKPAKLPGGLKAPFYRQFALLGASHSFAEQADIVVRRVHGWLKSHAGGKEITLK